MISSVVKGIKYIHLIINYWITFPRGNEKKILEKILETRK
jgi:hypothetical protein